MILVRAIQANIEMIGALLAAKIGIVTTATVTGQGVTTVYTGYASLLATSSPRQDKCCHRRSRERIVAPACIGLDVSISRPFTGRAIGYRAWYLRPLREWLSWASRRCRLADTSACLTDSAFLIIGGIIFAIFWIETTGMGPRALPEDPQLRTSRYLDTEGTRPPSRSSWRDISPR